MLRSDGGSSVSTRKAITLGRKRHEATKLSVQYRTDIVQLAKPKPKCERLASHHKSSGRLDRDEAQPILQNDVADATSSSISHYLTIALVHELRQPLTAALTFAETMVRAIEVPDVQGSIAAAKSAQGTVEQIVRATEIIRNFHDLITTGKGRYSRHSIRAMFEEAVSSALIGIDGVDVVIRAEIDALRLVRVNRVEIQQVIVNLIRNAVEAMSLTAEKRLDLSLIEASLGAAMIRIADTGPGIESETAARLFAPGRSAKPGGMGLGLCISRLIVEAHSGSIGAEPGQDGGAVFFFSLPLVDR